MKTADTLTILLGARAPEILAQLRAGRRERPSDEDILNALCERGVQASIEELAAAASVHRVTRLARRKAIRDRQRLKRQQKLKKLLTRY